MKHEKDTDMGEEDSPSIKKNYETCNTSEPANMVLKTPVKKGLP